MTSIVLVGAGSVVFTRGPLADLFGFFPTETSEHSAEYVPWYLRHDAEIDRLRIPVGEYLRVGQANLAQYAADREAVRLGADLDLHRDATEYAGSSSTP
jgi:alpha-galactosidase